MQESNFIMASAKVLTENGEFLVQNGVMRYFL